MMPLQGEIGESTLRVGNFIITLSEMDISSRQKVSKKHKVEFNYTTSHLDIIEIIDYIFQKQLT